jgi:hypothetical protein
MKNFFRLFGIITLAAVIGFGMAACNDGSKDNSNNSNNSNNNNNNTGNGTINLQNQHSTDSIYWFEMKNGSMVTIGEVVEVKPYFSKQFQVPAGTYIAGVTAGSATDLRQCTVTVSGGQTVNLVYNGSLSQQ